jgi:hypothetical protein
VELMALGSDSQNLAVGKQKYDNFKITKAIELSL